MLRHSQEIKEFVMNINFKGVFLLAVYLRNDGKQVYIQDKAQKYKDFIQTPGPDQEMTQNVKPLLQIKNHQYKEVPFKKYIQSIMTNIVQQKEALSSLVDM